MAKAVIVGGSNLGNREENLRRGFELVSLFAGKTLKTTPFLHTAPFGVEKQPPFVNAGVLVETCHPPLELLRLLKWIEKRVGRYPTYRWGPRVLDLDLVLYEGVRVESRELTLPHPGLRERDFFKELVEELLGENLHLFLYRL
jgi:2-amino-4-hydroxy-6-hydroxymethyldihydropteridine diphosphokinase